MLASLPLFYCYFSYLAYCHCRYYILQSAFCICYIFVVWLSPSYHWHLRVQLKMGHHMLVPLSPVLLHSFPELQHIRAIFEYTRSQAAAATPSSRPLVKSTLVTSSSRGEYPLARSRVTQHWDESPLPPLQPTRSRWPQHYIWTSTASQQKRAGVWQGGKCMAPQSRLLKL